MGVGPVHLLRLHVEEQPPLTNVAGNDLKAQHCRMSSGMRIQNRDSPSLGSQGLSPVVSHVSRMRSAARFRGDGTTRPAFHPVFWGIRPGQASNDGVYRGIKSKSDVRARNGEVAFCAVCPGITPVNHSVSFGVDCGL